MFCVWYLQISLFLKMFSLQYLDTCFILCDRARTWDAVISATTWALPWRSWPLDASPTMWAHSMLYFSALHNVKILGTDGRTHCTLSSVLPKSTACIPSVPLNFSSQFLSMFSMYIPLLRLSMSNVAHKILASVFSFISSPYLLLLLSIAELNNLK